MINNALFSSTTEDMARLDAALEGSKDESK